MTPDELNALSVSVGERRDSLAAVIAALPAASADTPSDDYASDTMMEALFLRMFTTYEATLEKLFLHYVTGGVSVSGRAAESFLSARDESHARRIVLAAFKFVSWAKPSNVRETATTYLNGGWPLTDMLGVQADTISDCEKIRNRIAHQSIEAQSGFNAVQRNLFQTERIFEMSPGHLLRVRYRGRRKLTLQHYNEVLSTTLQSVADPPI